MNTSDLLALSDNELVKLIVNTSGNNKLWNKAWDILVKRNARKLVSIFMQETHNQADAEMVVQDAFAKAVRSISSFKGDCQFSSWMYRIARNVWIDSVRSKKINERNTTILAPEEGIDIADPASDGKSHTDNLSQKEDLQLLQTALKRLKQRDRELIALRMKEITFREIAEMWKVNPTTLRTRYGLLIVRLRNIMAALRNTPTECKSKGLLRIFGRNKQ